MIQIRGIVVTTRAVGGFQQQSVDTTTMRRGATCSPPLRGAFYCPCRASLLEITGRSAVTKLCAVPQGCSGFAYRFQDAHFQYVNSFKNVAADRVIPQTMSCFVPMRSDMAQLWEL